MELFLFFALVISVIVLSGIVSGSEAAILSINYTKIKEILNNTKKSKIKNKAESLLFVKDNIQKYITTIVVLNNLINIIGSIYVGFLASKLFGELYLGLVSGVLTFMIIIFSEIIPKIYGEKHNKNIALFIAKPLIILTSILYPIVYIFQKIIGFLVKNDKEENRVSEGEIKEMAILGKLEGSINAYESRVIKNVFEMNDTEVYDIMVPKNEVITIEKDTPYDEIVKIVSKTGFTRFPVTDKGEILGIINAKDLFKYISNKDKFLIEKITRPVIYAPEAMKIFTLEQNLKKNRIHMAVVVNEHGDFTGIVTLEDVIEEVLGDMIDEFDNEEPEIIKLADNKFIVKGDYDIWELNEKFNLELNLKEDYTTLNGFLISKLGIIPKVNDKVKTDFGSFRVIKATKKKVLDVEMFLKS